MIERGYLKETPSFLTWRTEREMRPQSRLEVERWVHNTSSSDEAKAWLWLPLPPKDSRKRKASRAVNLNKKCKSLGTMRPFIQRKIRSSYIGRVFRTLASSSCALRTFSWSTDILCCSALLCFSSRCCWRWCINSSFSSRAFWTLKVSV